MKNKKKRTHFLTRAISPQTKEAEPIILDDNPISLLKYAEEYPKNWEEIMKQNKIKNEKN